MEAVHKEVKDRGRFSLLSEDKEVGFLTYYYSTPTVINADHTVVSPDFEGQGVGKELFNQLVAYAREKDFKIVAECPFISRMFERYKETKDLQVEEDYY